MTNVHTSCCTRHLARPSRRALLAAGAAVAGGSLVRSLAAPARAEAQTAWPRTVPADAIVVTLLGTGTPVPNPSRSGPATLVEAAGMRLLFDAGRGVTVRLLQAHAPLPTVDATFLTHYHSDHLGGLPDLWMTGYIPIGRGPRTRPFALYGPTGATALARTMRETFALDVRIREADQHLPDSGTQIDVHEFARDGVVFENNGVTVTAFEVNHGPLIKPAYGYRVDYGRRSVVISGDTKFDENVIRRATGCDLLVHEVCIAPEPPSAAALSTMNHHTSPEECGTVFARAKPRLPVFTHISQLPHEDGTFPTIAELIGRTRRTYAGPLVSGEDLMRFVVADEVTTHRWSAAL